MKKIFNIFNIIGCTALVALMALTGCKADDFPTPSEAGLAQAKDYEDLVTIMTDPLTNQVTFTLDAPGVMPVWIFDGKQYSTTNGLKKIYAAAGVYEVEVKILNANGVSDGSFFKSFLVENSLVDFNKYYTFLGGDNGRQWHFDNTVESHLACGPSGTTGTEWWHAQPNEKEGTGLYDNLLTFMSDGTYIFDPGESGTIYVNCGVNRYEGHDGTESVDYNVPVEKQESHYYFFVKGNDLYLSLFSNSLFPYIPNNEFADAPYMKVESMSASKMELVADNGEIAWHFILTSGSQQKKFTGFKYDSEFNLWRKANVESPWFWYAPGWNQIADPVCNFDGTTYTLNLPEATTDTWQGQMHITSDISLSAATNYDFSVILNTSKDHKNITLKLTDTTDDGNFLFVETAQTSAYEDCVFYLSDVPGIDAAAVKLVLDFGGNQADTDVTISKIVLKDHANDDGTVLPAEVPEDPNPGGNVNWEEGAGNLWNGCSYNMFYYYAPGWAQLPDPTVTDNGDGSYSFTLPEATFEQWQAQIAFKTDMSTSAATNYDFKCVINSSQDLKGVTVKLVMDGDDGVFYFADRVDITAYEDYVFTKVNMEGIDMERVNLFFDFGGNPANTEVTLSGIVLQEHAKPVEWDPTSEANIWNYSWMPTWYYAPGWAQLADPEVKLDGTSYSLNLPSATFDRWQAQMVFHTDIHTTAADKIDFHCVINSSNAFKVMVKLTYENDDNTFYCADEVNVEAYEDFVYSLEGAAGYDHDDPLKLVLDFGGNPDNTDITVSDIIIYKR